MMANDITTLDDLQAETLDLAQAYWALAATTTDPRAKMQFSGCAAALEGVARATGEQSNVLLAASVS